eukprot:13290-Chlamydomonas_euryale.AAC.1
MACTSSAGIVLPRIAACAMPSQHRRWLWMRSVLSRRRAVRCSAKHAAASWRLKRQLGRQLARQALLRWRVDSPLPHTITLSHTVTPPSQRRFGIEYELPSKLRSPLGLFLAPLLHTRVLIAHKHFQAYILTQTAAMMQMPTPLYTGQSTALRAAPLHGLYVHIRPEPLGTNETLSGGAHAAAAAPLSDLSCLRCGIRVRSSVLRTARPAGAHAQACLSSCAGVLRGAPPRPHMCRRRCRAHACVRTRAFAASGACLPQPPHSAPRRRTFVRMPLFSRKKRRPSAFRLGLCCPWCPLPRLARGGRFPAACLQTFGHTGEGRTATRTHLVGSTGVRNAGKDRVWNTGRDGVRNTGRDGVWNTGRDGVRNTGRDGVRNTGRKAGTECGTQGGTECGTQGGTECGTQGGTACGMQGGRRGRSVEHREGRSAEHRKGRSVENTERQNA